MNIFILTDAGLDIGLGHIMRCLAISQAFEEIGFQSTFIINGDYSNSEMLKFSYKLMNWHNEKENIFNSLKIKSNDLIIVDSNLIEEHYIYFILDNFKNVVVIDDFKRLNYKKGLIIDWTIFIENTYGINEKNESTAKYLLGSLYTALRKPFWRIQPNLVNKLVKTITITMGGSDLKNITPKILYILKKYPNVMKKVIIGSCFANIDFINNQLDDTTELVFYPSDIEIMDVFMNSDIVISAGGQTIAELACVGIPTITVAVNDNQLNDMVGWIKSDFIEYAGEWNNSSTFERIDFFVNRFINNYDLRKEKAIIGRKTIDGQGVLRIREFILNEFFIF